MLSTLRHVTRSSSPSPVSFCGLINRHLTLSRGEVNEEGLLRLLDGNNQRLDKVMSYDPTHNEDSSNPDDVPVKPESPQSGPKRGKSNLRLLRKAEILSKEKVRPIKRKFRKNWSRQSKTRDDFEPIPWNYQPDLKPRQPFVYFPPRPEVYTETKSFQWTRHNYLPEIGDIYPDARVQVEVTITSDLMSVENWAKERLIERNTILGLETKWWMKEKDGLYVSDSNPKEWADLALLQISTERDILLIQTLDMPVEKLGPTIRQILKYTFIKKIGFDFKSKSAALNMCDLRIHGCHEFPRLLQLQLACELGMTSIEALPKDILAQNLPSMSQSLLGLDLKSRDSCKAHWEMEYLQDDLIEIAAKEAWCCWALHGIITRMDQELLSQWESHLPDKFRQQCLIKEASIQKSLREENGILISHVAEAEARLALSQTPNWKVAKASAAALAHEVGLDLKTKVNAEIIQD